MALSRIATVVGGLLLSKGGRRFAGRHAGQLALATLAFELWHQHRDRAVPQAANPSTPPPGRRAARGGAAVVPDTPWA